jgi:hypothetical protein
VICLMTLRDMYQGDLRYRLNGESVSCEELLRGKRGLFDWGDGRARNFSQISQSNVAALSALVRLCQHTANRIAYLLTGAPMLAKDLVQAPPLSVPANELDNSTTDACLGHGSRGLPSTTPSKLLGASSGRAQHGSTVKQAIAPMKSPARKPALKMNRLRGCSVRKPMPDKIHTGAPNTLELRSLHSKRSGGCPAFCAGGRPAPRATPPPFSCILAGKPTHPFRHPARLAPATGCVKSRAGGALSCYACGAYRRSGFGP